MTKQHFFQWCAFFTMVSWSINWLNGISFQNIQLSLWSSFLRFAICKSIHSCLLQGASMKLPHLHKGKIGLPICSLSFAHCKWLGSKTNHRESWPRTINYKTLDAKVAKETNHLWYKNFTIKGKGEVVHNLVSKTKLV